jgi:uncharacterized protein YkwD
VNHLRKLLAATILTIACASPAAGAPTGGTSARALAGAASAGVRAHGDTRSPHGRRDTARAGRRHAGRARRSPEVVVLDGNPPARAQGSTPAALAASVLAAPCENTELTPTPDNLAEVAAATLCLVNQERAREEEPPLQPDPRLAQAARLHSEEMVAEDYFDHVAPDGETPLDRVRAGGYIPNSLVGYTIGENIAWGTLDLATPSAIVAAWIASPEHLANILRAEYRDTAIGVVAAAPASLSRGQPGAVYTQEFGVIVP